MLAEKNWVILGGTGSFGKAFVLHLLNNLQCVERIVIYSRDEHKQYELKSLLNPDQRRRLRFIIGDVRDSNRLSEAMAGADVVVHAAAIKHVPIAEENPVECFTTNIMGTSNIVQAAISCRVGRVVALSTDKAVLPIGAYGASKMALEKIIIAGNTRLDNTQTRFCVVRYANVFGSRGSVIPFFLRERKKGVLPITDPRMTRFSITLQDGIDLVLFALRQQEGGEVFVPKASSYKITSIAEAIGPDCKIDVTGIRESEKISELMLSRYEASRTLDLTTCFVVLPESGSLKKKDYMLRKGGCAVPEGFEYDSATNDHWMTVEQIRSQIDLLQNHES